MEWRKLTDENVYELPREEGIEILVKLSDYCKENSNVHHYYYDYAIIVYSKSFNDFSMLCSKISYEIDKKNHEFPEYHNNLEDLVRDCTHYMVIEKP
jgi:hypothetical protein